MFILAGKSSAVGLEHYKQQIFPSGAMLVRSRAHVSEEACEYVTPDSANPKP